MLKEEIKLRKRIGDIVLERRHWSWSTFDSDVRALEKAARADERERCAKVADPVHRHHPAAECGLCTDRKYIAAAIRRG